MKQRIIYHHPDVIVENGDSGSQVRPAKMLAAFKNLGFTVDEVTGNSSQRAAAIKDIKKRIREGVEYAFLYSENRSIPTPLTETHRLPLHPFLDHLFFRFCKHNSIPVGLFYRDIYWRFSMYKDKLSLIARSITIPLYWYDWLIYQHYVDHLFLPSLKMREHLPTQWPFEGLSALPPGTAPSIGSKSALDRSPTKSLSLLYIGGTLPPNYDLSPLFKLIKNLTNVRLTLICRSNEWDVAKHYYGELPKDKVVIRHVSGEALRQEYRSSDLFTLIREPYIYLDFAAPVKIFEAAANCLPIITLGGTEASEIIRRERLGWVDESLEDIVKRINQLDQDRSLLAAKSAELEGIRHNQTWESRAKAVAEKLLNLKKS